MGFWEKNKLVALVPDTDLYIIPYSDAFAEEQKLTTSVERKTSIAT